MLLWFNAILYTGKKLKSKNSVNLYQKIMISFLKLQYIQIYNSREIQVCEDSYQCQTGGEGVNFVHCIIGFVKWKILKD